MKQWLQWKWHQLRCRLGFDNFRSIMKEARKHQTELVTYCGDNVGRWEGFGFDMEDYYYIIYYPEEKHCHWCSCVGGLKFLSDTLTKEAYMEEERKFAERVRTSQKKWIAKMRRAGDDKHQIDTTIMFTELEHIHPKFIRRDNGNQD